MSELVKLFIREWERVRETVPEPASSAENEPVEQMIAEIYSMSRQKRHWEPFVTLLGYSSEQRERPNQVLYELPGLQPPAQPERLILESPYLRYAERYTTLGRPALVSGVYEVKVMAMGRPIRGDLVLADSYDECRTRCQQTGDYWECYWNCVRSLDRRNIRLGRNL